MTLPPTTSALAIVPDVTVAQLIGSEPVPLAYGQLRLEEVSSSSSSSTSTSTLDPTSTPVTASAAATSASEPILLVRVGEKVVFPLYAHTIFGTHADEETWYTFDLPLPPVESSASAPSSSVPSSSTEPAGDAQSKTWVRLVLPPLSTPEVLSARDTFEDALIARSLLLSGVRAAGDELGSSATETGTSLSSSLSQASQSHISTTSADGAGEGAWKFSRASHRTSESVLRGSQALSGATQTAAEAMAGLATAAGGALGSAYQSIAGSFGGGASASSAEDQQAASDSRVMPNTRDALSDAFNGASSGASSLYNTATTEAPRFVQHNAGEEAAKLANEVGQTASNTGGALVDVTLGTSTIFHGAQAAKGAAGAGETEEASKGEASTS
ncbi:hypothetical protein BCV69DRAFT_284911 [Microstroma glucosiphilum]|uniref:Senescence domain-containing protein n=1 Tax=Pseudomicrostroma glucosiphilum TaxID=1684307 RepID=A0A316U157_9BASI|nr:hypothetical protein BCV69DRAFT_284911 [Pseudomicrostroma glucosiphilum]PWN18604.1 hypothetical protein BCV69DRAFT_284911 [Pseudomicrostroma glucosiphilum]